jgi:hypothetical protein
VGRAPFIVVLLVAVVAALGPAAGRGLAAPTAGGGGVAAFGPLVDLRPEAVPAGGVGEARVSLARNDTASYQLRVPGPLRGADIEARPLAGPLGATIPASAITVYREDYYDVVRRSDAEGASGLWPDALIPQRDPLYGEPRNAFPVDVAAGGQLAIWVDVTAAAQLPGVYRGEVRISDAAGTVAEVPVTATVEPFTIPSTATLKSAFFVNSDTICAAFGGCTGDQRAAYSALFAEAALNNRLTLADAYGQDAPTESGFTKYFLPLLDGIAPHVHLPGARLTSVEVWGATCGDCLGPWKRAADADGFAERFFLYACDEPVEAAEWADCEANVARAERSWPEVRALVTASYEPAAQWVDIYAPIVNELFPDSGLDLLYPRTASAYLPWVDGAARREFWSYTSCRSYSCTGVEGPEYGGWPAYAIDEPPFEAGAMSWLAFLYGFTGELYYSTTEALATATTNQYSSGGNGDGNLFYAGTPDGGDGSIAVGGKTPIPIESIRLKRIRDGREDYEYLHLAEERGFGLAARSIAVRLFGSLATAPYETAVPAAKVEAARAELGDLLSRPAP